MLRQAVNRRLDTIVRPFYDILADTPWESGDYENQVTRAKFILLMNNLRLFAEANWHNKRLFALLLNYGMWAKENQFVIPVPEGYQYLFPKPKRP